MAEKSTSNSSKTPPSGKPSSLIDTRVIYCGDNLDQLKKFPDGCVDLIYIDPPFNSNRNYEVFWGETKEKRSFEDRHASTQAYIDAHYKKDYKITKKQFEYLASRVKVLEKLTRTICREKIETFV